MAIRWRSQTSHAWRLLMEFPDEWLKPIIFLAVFLLVECFAKITHKKKQPAEWVLWRKVRESSCRINWVSINKFSTVFRASAWAGWGREWDTRTMMEVNEIDGVTRVRIVKWRSPSKANIVNYFNRRPWNVIRIKACFFYLGSINWKRFPIKWSEAWSSLRNIHHSEASLLLRKLLILGKTLSLYA